MARQYYYNADASETTTTSSTYGDKASVTFTPDASSNYLILWCCRLSNSTATIDGLLRLRDDTAASNLGELNLESQDTSSTAGSNEPVFGSARWTSGGSPSSQTFSVEFASNGGTNTTRVSQCAIYVMKMDSADEYAESLAQSDTTSGSPQDKTTLTFTPASQGDYLIIATAEGKGNTTSANDILLLDHASTTYASKGRRPKDSGNWMPWGTIVKLNLTASSKTFKIQWADENGAVTSSIRNARITALRLSAFSNVYYAEDRSRTTTAGVTEITKLTHSPAPSNTGVDHLVMWCHQGDQSATNNSCFYRHYEGSTLMEEPLWESVVASTSLAQTSIMFNVRHPSNVAYAIKHQQESGAVAVGIQDAASMLLEIGDSNVTGTIANTLQDATAAFSGSVPFTGTLATTLAGATSSITALETYSGALSTTLGNATSSITAVETYSGTLATTLGDATAAFTGNVSDINTSGAIATTLDNFTSAIAALETYTGTIATTLAGATSNIVAVETYSGTLATTLGNATMSASGSLTFAGSLATTLGNATSAITAVETYSGTLGTTLGNATMSATGSVPYVGTLSTTLDNFTMDATGDNGSGIDPGTLTPFRPVMRPRRR